MARFQTVCNTDDVPDGSARMFVVDGVPIGIFCVAGEFFALDNRCPHAGASLAHGIIDGDTVACRIHHWRFCIRDGTYLDEARQELNAHRFPIRVVGQEVQVEI
jgi:nitrite reductase (NADH) small subunit